MKRYAFPIVCALMTGCSSVTPIPDQPWIIEYSDNCKVTIYQTEADAKKRGTIDELCVIEGTSLGSFKHTPETAIRKHAEKACECNANKVYVQSRSPMDWGVAKASMVAFMWANE